MRQIILIAVLAVGAVGQSYPDIHVKAADAIGKECPAGMKWESGNSISDQMSASCPRGAKSCYSGPISFSGNYEDYVYWHCVGTPTRKPKPPQDVPAVEEKTDNCFGDYWGCREENVIPKPCILTDKEQAAGLMCFYTAPGYIYYRQTCTDKTDILMRNEQTPPKYWCHRVETVTKERK